jgi:type II secretory pathway component PulF
MRQGAAPKIERLPGVFPPLLAWLITAGGRQETLTAMARHVADTYRRRIARQSAWLRDYLPLWLTVVVGGCLVAFFAVMMLLPYVQLMQDLGVPAGQSMRIKP